jgi:hypothetical protein
MLVQLFDINPISMSKKIILPLLLFSLLCLTFCRNDGKKDIRNYYFPLKALEEGLVYEYTSVNNDSLTPAYWFYRSFISKEGVYLTGTYYEYELIPLQVVREELVRNGMLIKESFLYERPDSNGLQDRVSLNIQADNIFPFEVSDSSGIFLYKATWEPISDPGATVTLVKNRRYAGDTTITYNDRRYDAVIFNVKELIEYDKEGVFEQTYDGREIYAKGLGLVYYDKTVADGVAWAYRLNRQYPMEELEDTFRQRLLEEDDIR